MLRHGVQRQCDAHRRNHADAKQHRNENQLEENERPLQPQGDRHQQSRDEQPDGAPRRSRCQTSDLHHDAAADHQSQRIAGEADAVLQGRQSEMLLEDERRGGDVGDQRGRRKTLQQVHHQIFAVRYHGYVASEGFPDGHLQAVFFSQRLRHAAAYGEQPQGPNSQHGERSLPGGQAECHAPDDRCHDGRHALHGGEHGEVAGHVLPGERIGDDRFRDDQSGGSRQSLQQPEEDKGRNPGGEHAARRGQYEKQQAPQQRAPAAVFVRNGADEKLSGGQPQHAGMPAVRLSWIREAEPPK